MTQEDYERILQYDYLSDDIKILQEMAICFRTHDTRHFSDREFRRMFDRAIFLCQDMLPDVFEIKIKELAKERGEL